MTWNTNGLDLGFYAVQFIVDDGQVEVAIDLLLDVVSETNAVCKSTCGNAGALCNTDDDCFQCTGSRPFCITNTPPEFVPPTPGIGGSSTTISTPLGAEVVYDVVGADVDGDNVYISNGALPPNAFVSDVGVGHRQFRWTPQLGDTDFVVCWSIEDDRGGVRPGQHCITVGITASRTLFISGVSFVMHTQPTL